MGTVEIYEPLDAFIARAAEAFSHLWALLGQELTAETLRGTETYFYQILAEDPSLTRSLDAVQILNRIKLKKAALEAIRAGAVQLESHETPKDPTHPDILEIIQASRSSTHPVFLV